MTAVPHMGARRAARSLPRSRTTHHVRTGVMSTGGFAFGVLLVLSVALLALLALNTALTKGSFRVHDLFVQTSDLSQQAQVLQAGIADAESPNTLTRRAREMGMLPAANPAFISVDQGKILGEPFPAGSNPLADVPGGMPLTGVTPNGDSATAAPTASASAGSTDPDAGLSLAAEPEGQARPSSSTTIDNLADPEQPLGMTEGTDAQ